MYSRLGLLASRRLAAATSLVHNRQASSLSSNLPKNSSLTSGIKLAESTQKRLLSTTNKKSGKIQDITRHPGVWDRAQDERWNEVDMERYADQADVLIVGGGPAGLAAAIKLKQLYDAADQEIRICVFEKAAEFGRHTLSGACLEPRALFELWSKEELEELECPALKHPVENDIFLMMTEEQSIDVFKYTPESILKKLPMYNHGNYIIRLGHLVAWMAEQAESMGIELYPGFAATETLYHEDGSIKGIATNDVGIDKFGGPKDSFARGMEFHGKITIFGEGCRGSESQKLIEKFDLTGDCPQHYGIGIKELWKVPKENHVPGTILHTAGWPLNQNEYGGSFMYHIEEDGEPLIALGFVIGLDYKNPYINTFETFQTWKQHPDIRKYLEGGECLQYGARALNEGGFQARIKQDVPGGLIIGCSAGLLNVPKIKGTHLAMKSGMVAAETIFRAFQDEERMKEYWTDAEEEEYEEEEDEEVDEEEVDEDAEEDEEEDEEWEDEEEEADYGAFPTLHKGVNLPEFEQNIKDSWIHDDLYAVRNVKPAAHKFKGLFGMMGYTGLSSLVGLGKEPWTFKWHKKDHEYIEPAAMHEKPKYYKPDGKVSFDILTQVALSGTNHEHDQPAHLALKDDDIPVSHNYALYDGPENRFCPAGVYEYIKDEDSGAVKLNINAQNCVHCKTCSIKDPTQNIVWCCPEGSGGPTYDGM